MTASCVFVDVMLSHIGVLMYICTPEAVQIKLPRLTIYPVTAQEVSIREHEQWASGGGWAICISPRKRMGERQALEPCSSVRRLAMLATTDSTSSPRTQVLAANVPAL